MQKSLEMALRHVYSRSDVSAYPVGSADRVAEYSREHLTQHAEKGVYVVDSPSAFVGMWHLTYDGSCYFVIVATEEDGTVNFADLDAIVFVPACQPGADAIANGDPTEDDIEDYYRDDYDDRCGIDCDICYPSEEADCFDAYEAYEEPFDDER